MTLPILFSHYGDTDYLARTLEAARLSNPQKRLILIGDAQNMETARRCGWEHVDMDRQTSALRGEFLASYREVRGRLHDPNKGGRNWVRYVTERWFIIEAFIKSEGIGAFWHFDSDVMITVPLTQFETELQAEGFAYTRQCSNICLNGFVTAPVVEDFCRFTFAYFRNSAKLDFFQKLYDEKSPGYALTEMQIFSEFAQESGHRGCHLERHFPGCLFDDVLCEDDGCEMARLGYFGPAVKNVGFDGRDFFVRCGKERLVLTSLNCSWLPLSVFDWILDNLRGAASNSQLSGTRWLRAVPPGLALEVRGFKAWVKQNIPLARKIHGLLRAR